mmetsp:Transcript_107092/g.268407  ORF Transcript_107092/g.268407 Transcript_107092/m.268407 type:complete len:261 (+) Transcript_107092:1557-2339(+)
MFRRNLCDAKVELPYPVHLLQDPRVHPPRRSAETVHDARHPLGGVHSEASDMRIFSPDEGGFVQHVRTFSLFRRRPPRERLDDHRLKLCCGQGSYVQVIEIKLRAGTIPKFYVPYSLFPCELLPMLESRDCDAETGGWPKISTRSCYLLELLRRHGVVVDLDHGHVQQKVNQGSPQGNAHCFLYVVGHSPTHSRQSLRGEFPLANYGAPTVLQGHSISHCNYCSHKGNTAVSASYRVRVLIEIIMPVIVLPTVDWQINQI